MSRSVKRAAFREYVAALQKELGEGPELPPQATVLMVYGSSEYLLGRTLDLIRKRATAGGMPQATMEASAVTEAVVTQIAGQSSLFDPASLYVLRRVEQAKSLPKLLKNVPATGSANRLVLVYRGDSPPAPLRTELTRLKCRMIPCFEPWPNEVPQVVGLISQDLGAKNFKLKADAVNLLMELNGADLGKHANELAKLSLLFKDAAAPLGASDIAPHLGMLRDDDAFQLDRLLLQKDFAKAQALVTNLFARGEKGIALLGILAGHCRNVLKITDAQARGVPGPELAGVVRLPPFILKTYTQHLGSGANRVETGRYARALALCQETDKLLKSSSTPDELLIVRVIDALATP